MAFACAQGGIRCSCQLSGSNSKVSADDPGRLLQALNLSTHRSIIGRSTAQQMIRTVVLIHLGVISSGRCEKIDFAEISSEPKCMPKAQRSLIRHPGATFFKAEIAPRF
jgi:hypothetical protein